ncbi:APC family permease [Vagococcus vulneris]|uniref:Amino acid permease n=1 Tax=Vagococcus vulneris TaxID=1977869 RepID=A0A429ZWM4_9ENTE|nr:APC family permease [Vagococcus vulneris]RST98184.1 hypothetical protein CBF37_08425 [Vagococcus vulneris]
MIIIIEKKEYGLWTAVSMIVGICVGSGIFFKIDDILLYTGGHIYLGVLVFIIGALSIIFGSISLTNLAALTDKSGGMVAYFEAFFSSRLASAFGWFQTFLYYPTVAVVVAWASGIYTTLLFNLPHSLDVQMAIGLFYLLFFYTLNILSRQFGGYFQVISSFAKLIPLLAIGVVALFWHQPHPEIPTETVTKPIQNVGFGWLAALAPMAFSYDGWPIALSISHEVRRSKKTMPIALTIGPIIVLAVYLSYYLGMSHILGAEYIMSVGDGAVTTIGELLVGTGGKTVLLVFVLISILGVVNGVVLGHLRMPYALMTKKMFPSFTSNHQKETTTKLKSRSALISLIVGLIWYAIHYATQKFGLLTTGDVSEIAIVFGYFYYILLYTKVLHLYWTKQITNTLTGLIAPILAIIGGLVIIIGGVLSNPISMITFFIICSLFCYGGYHYFKQTNYAKNTQK